MKYTDSGYLYVRAMLIIKAIIIWSTSYTGAFDSIQADKIDILIIVDFTLFI